MLFWGQFRRATLLIVREDEDGVGEEEEEEKEGEPSEHFTYYLATKKGEVRCLEEERPKGEENEEKEDPYKGIPGPSTARPATAFYRSTTYHEPTTASPTSATAFYAVLGLSRCWRQPYTVTSAPSPPKPSNNISNNINTVTADAMEEGVATEPRGGASEPGVTGLGWTLPCSLSSLLAMNCRARAEELARRLQSRVKVTNGDSIDLEHRSLVTTSTEGPYASMDYRHSSFDDSHLRSLEEHNLRPIHVVTSEPTLHLRPLSPPSHNPATEQDSDVYYDFDLASPDYVVDEVEEENGREVAPIVNGERPESGCVTSVTSPLMFDEEVDDDVGDNNPSSGDLYPPQCSPDADLRAVRQILSSSSVNENQYQPCESEIGSTSHKRFSEESADEEKIHRDKTLCDCSQSSHECRVCSSDECSEKDSPHDEKGVSEKLGDKCIQCRSGQVGMAVASTGSCRCHTACGTRSALSHLPSSPDRHSVPAASSRCDPSDGVFTYNTFEICKTHENDDFVKTMTDDEERQENKEKDQKNRVCGKGGLAGTGEEREETEIHSLEDVCFKDELECNLTLDGKSETPTEEEELRSLSESVQSSTAKETCGDLPTSISGTTPPLAEEAHLYVPSEEQPAIMEARSGSEGDLYGKDEVFSADSDNEVIETLGEDEDASEQEENEDDLEEEVILTGKFRNIRGYQERVRRLSDEVEDHPLPPVVTQPEVVMMSEPEEMMKSVDLVDEEKPISSSDVATQLSKLDIEEISIKVEEAEGEKEEKEEKSSNESRSSSEDTDPERVEDFKMRIKRSSSLKCGKTPPGTPGRKKIVRFADVLGLDLAAVRTFLAGVPHVPRSAFWDLEVEREKFAGGSAVPSPKHVPPPMPRRVLTPLFQQPGTQNGFMDRVRLQKVVVENVIIGEDLSVRGTVRVLSMDFHKSVYVRYTFDQWRNYHEATAVYVPGSHDGATDRFSFLLWGSFLQDNGALMFCIRYNTLGREYWDNNFGRNYSLQCYSTGLTGNPQNSSSVQGQYMCQGNRGSSTRQSYSGFDSPVTPNDPWVTRFF